MKSLIALIGASALVSLLVTPAQSQDLSKFTDPGTSETVTITSMSPAQNPYGRLNPLLPEDLISSGDVKKIDTRLIIVYKSTPTKLQRRDLLSTIDVAEKEKVSLATRMSLEILEFESKSAADVAIQTLRASNLVESVNRDLMYQITTIPNDPDYSKTWGMEQMNVPTAWNTTKGSSNIIVGVIDTGIDLDHPDLIDNIWINTDEIPNNGIDDDSNGYIDDVHGWDFVNNDNVPNDDVTSDHWASGHGTHVAGTIAGVGNNSIGVAGVAWEAKLMALKICGPWGCSLSDHVLALQYAYNNGAQVVNESFGGGYSGYDWERDAIAAVAEPGTGEQKGLLVVAAGGNNAANTEISPFHPANYRLENHISVAATESNGNLANFSNFSATNIDVAAPGSGIWSTLPEGAFNTTGGYGSLSGTSMAAPHVAGVAVLIQASHPTWKPSDIRKALIGTVQATSALESRVFSGGIVDAAAAVALTSVPSAQLLIRQIGTGTGTVQIGSTSCDGATCRLDNTRTFTLSAIASPTSTFQGWYGECSGNASTCSITSSHVSPVVSAKFSEPSDPNISVDLLESSASTPMFSDGNARNWLNLSNTKLSADGTVRARAVWRAPYWCWYLDSDTGGITIERNVDGTWVEEAKFIAPSLDDSRPAGRFANCELFGREMVLSEDGNTLSVLLGAYIQIDLPNPDNDYIICGAAVYRKQVDGTWSNATLLTPEDKYDCLKTVQRTPESMEYWSGVRSLTMSDDGNVVFVSSADKILKFDITNLENIQKSVIEMPTNCIILTSHWNQWFNMSSDFWGTSLIVPTTNCASGADSYVISMGVTNTFIALPATPWVNFYVAKTAMSEDGSLIALSYREWERGVVIFEKVGSSWVERVNLNTLPYFEGFVNCTKFSDDKRTLICDSQFNDVGRNSQQGKVLLYDSDSPSWSSSISQQQFWATFGSPFDWASVTAATDDLMRFDTNISGNAIGINYAYNIMGSTFDIARIPLFLNLPSIDGLPSVGAVLTAMDIGVSGVSQNDVEYQWLSCSNQVTSRMNEVPSGCTEIPSATNSQYTVTSAVLGKYISLKVSATNLKGSATVFSHSLPTPIRNTAVLRSAPTLSGVPMVGQTLRTTSGSWVSTSKVTLTNQWQRCSSLSTTSCVNINRATSKSYKLTASDGGMYIRNVVSAKNSAGTVSVATAMSAQVGVAPSLSGTISISGSARIGSILTASTPQWIGPALSVSYQWMQCASQVRSQTTRQPRGCIAISDSLSLTFTIRSGDVGKFLLLRTTASNDYGTSTIWSKSTSKVSR